MPTGRHGIQAAKCNGGFYVAYGRDGARAQPEHRPPRVLPGAGSARPCGGVGAAFGKSWGSGATRRTSRRRSSSAPTAGCTSRSRTAMLIGVHGRAHGGERLLRHRDGEHPRVHKIPNHDDDGAAARDVSRLVTGIVVTGTAPPRSCTSRRATRASARAQRVAGPDLNLDTNSGIVSRLTGPLGHGSRTSCAACRARRRITRQRPRARRRDGTRCMSRRAATRTWAAPSQQFAFLPEYALSAAILSIDLDAIGSTTYDLPTLDDRDAPATNDASDPFGGNDGRNQAISSPAGPVQVYAPGFRNPYDLLITPTARCTRSTTAPTRAGATCRSAKGRTARHQRGETSRATARRWPAPHHRARLLRRASESDARQQANTFPSDRRR